MGLEVNGKEDEHHLQVIAAVISPELTTWEHRLKPYLSQVELLAEIPINCEEFEEIEEEIRWVFKLYYSDAIALYKFFPSVFVTYLAFKAAYNEERDFWGNIAKKMGLPSSSFFYSQNHHWGKMFLKIIAKNHLRTFKEVPSDLKYITPIRLHGGISVHSLPDFFEHLLLPSVKRDDYRDMNDKKALNELLKRSAVEYYVDDVVRYFFQYGEEPALRFFSKCRKMARLAVKGKPIPSPKELGLRPYVVQAFENYLQNPPEPSQRRLLPRLKFDPYEPSFVLVLPSQPVTFSQAGFTCEWMIHLLSGGKTVLQRRTKTRVRSIGGEWRTEESTWSIEQPAEHVQVSLIIKHEESEEKLLHRSIRLLPAPDTVPLLAFRFEDRVLKPFTSVLPAETLWLFYPADVELEFEGDGHCVESLHPFSPPWEDWQAGAWDLSRVHLIRLLRSGEDICPPIFVRKVREPQLTGTMPPSQIMQTDEKPLYLGAPRLELPLRNIHNPEPELQQWQFVLTSLHPAKPAGKWEGRANEMPYEIDSQDGKAIVDFASWLSEEPVGAYQLLLCGPGRYRKESQFQTFPKLEIGGLKPYYLPGEQGAEPIEFHIGIPEGCKLLSLDEDNLRIDKLPNQNYWQITVPAEIDQADLALEYPAQIEPIRIPIQIALPRLRWSLHLSHFESLTWQSKVISLSLAELLQSQSARFLVELPTVEAKSFSIDLDLKTPEQEEPLQSNEDLTFNRLGQIECNLGGYSDTLRAHHECSIFEFWLTIFDKEENTSTSLPVLRLTRELEIQHLHFELSPDSRWRIHWFEPRPLRYRHLRMWSLWQPWAPPADIPLPDDALPSDSTSEEGWWMADIPAEYSLPPSWYKVQFIAVAPDDRLPPPKTPPSKTVMVELITPQDRLRQIEQDLRNHPQRAFVLHFEKACIYESIGDGVNSQNEIQWCLSHWREANPIHLMSLMRWVGRSDRNTQRAVLTYMFHPDTLKKLGGHDQGFIHEYLETIAEAKTISPESARIAIGMSKSPKVHIKALKVLLQNRDEDAVDFLWKEMDAGHLSVPNVAEVLASNPSFALEQLSKYEDSPYLPRLLLEFSQHHPIPDKVVRCGYWVYSDAGWGTIVEIQNAGKSDVFFTHREKPILKVVLREGIPGEQVAWIDLQNRQISFEGRTAAYICACQRFIHIGGKENEPIWQVHQEFCQFSERSPIKFPYCFNNELYYSAKRPDNPLV